MRESWLRPYVYEPFTQFSEGRLRGRYVNVDAAGFRWSAGQCPWPPPPSSDSVFVFGGSTTFGYGLPDSETIPSHLQQLLRARSGGASCVYNFGRGWYYSSQELVLFERLLVAGFVPRRIVFIDGLNDFLYPQDAPRFTRQLRQYVARINAHLAPDAGEAERLRSGRGPRPLSPENDARTGPAAMVERYERNRRVATALARAFSVHPLFVWQPVPVIGCEAGRHPFPERLRDVPWARTVREGHRLLAARRQAEPELVWCADLRGGSGACDYLDTVHYGPALSRRIAACIAEGLSRVAAD